MRSKFDMAKEFVIAVRIERAFVKWRVQLVILTHFICLPSGRRISSLSLSPAQQRREATHFRTPPISRGRHKTSANLIDGSRVSGHVYKHLQEDESTEMESIRRYFCLFVSFVMFSLILEEEILIVSAHSKVS